MLFHMNMLSFQQKPKLSLQESYRFIKYVFFLMFIHFFRILVQKDARLLRDLRIIAYFRQCFPSDANITTSKELARALAAHPPYEISISSVQIKHLHCQVGSATNKQVILI